MKNQKGITLVALVVTIIVLLILAGISLSLISGSDGILNQATNAADTNADRSAQEQVELLLAEAKNNYYERRYVTRDLGSSDTETSVIAAYVSTHATNTVSAGTVTMDSSTGAISLTVTQTSHVYNVKYNDGSLTYVSSTPSGLTWPGALTSGS